jgi:hypothetical protein
VARKIVQKLGIKDGMRLYVKGCPVDYASLLCGLADGVTLERRIAKDLDCIHLFTKSADELSTLLAMARRSITPDGMIWVSWPKRASRVETDVTEDVIRAICSPLDLVDVKVCAVDETWSGLKLVVRKEKR